MFILRKAQVQVLARVARGCYVERLSAYLAAEYPEPCARLGGEAERRAFIEHGIDRARPYRIESERDVRGYVECMLLLGRDFDKDPKLPWAGKVLGDEKTNAGAKIASLKERAKTTQHHTAKPAGT